MTSIVQDLVNALNLGSMYALYALGISVVFGIMRLINFAHYSLILAGGYTMVLTGSWPLVLRVIATVAVCVALAVLLELVAFRGARGASPTTLLITSFAVSFVIAAVAEFAFGSLPRSTTVSPWLRNSLTIGDVYIPRINLVTLVVTLVLLTALSLLLAKTTIGLQMRAAAEDFTTSRLLGVRANKVISLAFAISGVLAAAVAVLLLGTSGQVTPTFGLSAVLFGLIAAVAGGLDSLKGAVIGGFALGIASQLLQRFLPLPLRPYRDAFLFLAVFVLLVVRPQGIVSRGSGARV
ncbi:branched-chain amino acid ABC transporter permease [Desertimonas flava]|uniref:branched-chain amino acid ABC transporter permease n=1 Tax=Desertimonas flava TaxID=2064846 RepID=UPI000E341FBF|nr:branched-chain amino acid ABC transporter permease [Desertimonas flava]